MTVTRQLHEAASLFLKFWLAAALLQLKVDEFLIFLSRSKCDLHGESRGAPRRRLLSAQTLS